MLVKCFRNFKKRLTEWITYETPLGDERLPFDYSKLKLEIKPGDVLLIEGRSRVSNVIRYITQSSWTHAALYLGTADSIKNEAVRTFIKKKTPLNSDTPLIFEDLMDEGTIITPLSKYQHHHIRICRPKGITTEDVQRVINYCISSLGAKYNVRHLFDLFRFLLPWSILPRRWGSSLFKRKNGRTESSICSSRLAEAFASVRFPILPFMRIEGNKGVEFIQRNPQLFTPKDFDTSPYFEIIKYPLFTSRYTIPYYRRLPWAEENLIYDDDGIITATNKNKQKGEEE